MVSLLVRRTGTPKEQASVGEEGGGRGSGGAYDIMCTKNKGERGWGSSSVLTKHPQMR